MGNFQDGGSTRHLGNYPQDPGNEVAIKPEHRLSTWVGKRERFPTNFAIMSQSESYFASLGVVKWLPCELLREKWRQTTKRGVTTTRHERELIFFLYLFSISNKVTFRIFFLLKNGGWISTLSTPPVSAPENVIVLLGCVLTDHVSIHEVTLTQNRVSAEYKE